MEAWKEKYNQGGGDDETEEYRLLYLYASISLELVKLQNQKLRKELECLNISKAK
jgi:hypothetical protein